MKKIIIFTSVFAIILTLIVPFQAFASHLSGRRERSSSISRRVSNLGGDRVDNIPMPILFGLTPDNIRSDFGDPRAGHTHEGLDIIAPRRALIVTPTDAIVTRVGTGESAGKNVYTANPGGETFAYLHLDEIADIEEGDELQKGDFIGYVGNTGNASGGVTHLHFEIRDDGDATDPYPRIQSIFPIADKIKYLKAIIDDAEDPKNLSERIVVLYRKELVLAKSLSIALPPTIEAALITIPATVTNIVPKQSNVPTNGNLTTGSRGPLVTALQTFLKKKNVGTASQIVADGSFGPITKRALAEYQASVGLTADGYYGPITRAYITSHP
jgi:hypothetical protein